MAIKNFIVEANQRIWNSYYNKKLNEWSEANAGKLNEINKQKTSLAQYKPILLKLDGYLHKSFYEITMEDYEKFKNHTTKQSKFSYVQGFFIYCITNGFVVVKDKEFIKSLIPEIYRPLMEFLM